MTRTYVFDKTKLFAPAEVAITNEKTLSHWLAESHTEVNPLRTNRKDRLQSETVSSSGPGFVKAKRSRATIEANEPGVFQRTKVITELRQKLSAPPEKTPEAINFHEYFKPPETVETPDSLAAAKVLCYGQPPPVPRLGIACYGM